MVTVPGVVDVASFWEVRTPPSETVAPFALVAVALDPFGPPVVMVA
jgi:hypothetical protein